MREHGSGADPVLRVENLAVTYRTRDGAVPAVRDVSFEIARGETFGLVGESGSGKSTVALAIMNYLGANGHATGAVRYVGQNVLSLGARQLRKLRGSRLAMVYQDPMSALNPAIPVGEQISEGLRLHQGVGKRAAFARAIEMMRQTQIPDPEVNARRYPHQLSGGMQQRVVIAMALINNPDVLILDEPTTGLDVTTEATILDLIADLRREFNSAVLFITHDLGVIAQVSDQIGVMYAGELVETGATRDIFARPQHPYTLALLSTAPSVLTGGSRLAPIPGRLPDLRHLPPGCVFALRCRFAEGVCTESAPPLAPLDDPSHLAACFFSAKLPSPGTDPALAAERQMPQRGDRQPAEPLLTARDLRVFFQERSLFDTVLRRPATPVQAVDGVTLTLHRGETVGLVGESGSGKTTFGKTLVRLYDPTAGALTIGGTNVRDLSPGDDRALRKRIQFIFQNPESALNPRQSAGEIIARPLRLYHLTEERAIPDRVAELLTLVQLRPEFATRYPHELSGGEKQRVGIARAFAAEPDVIVADEPLSALDVSVQASILNLLVDLQDRYGTSYLFISHDLGTVRHLCDRVYVMYLGNTYETGTVEQVFSPPYHPYTEALLSAIPVPDPTISRDRIRLEGPVPSPRRPPTGCKFHTRCPRKWGPICEQEPPPAQEAGPGHVIQCHRPLDTLSQELFGQAEGHPGEPPGRDREPAAPDGRRDRERSP